LGIKFDHNIRALIRDPNIVLRVDLDRVGVGPCVQVVSDLSHKLAILPKFQKLCCSRSIRRASRVAPREDEDVTFGINRNASHFTKIEIVWKMQEVRYRTVWDFGDLRSLSRKKIRCKQ